VPEERRISIVEDDDSLRTALVGLMRTLGYRADAFNSAEQFLATGDRGAGACIISDLQMPGLSGIELTQRLRSAGGTVPVILITARTEPGLEEKALASGALCLLRKPFETERLVSYLEQALAADRSHGRE
jgi:FixJ family two-component response regulator